MINEMVTTLSIEDVTLEVRQNLICIKIKNQFPNIPEYNLCFAVVEQAISDVISNIKVDLIDPTEDVERSVEKFIFFRVINKWFESEEDITESEINKKRNDLRKDQERHITSAKRAGASASYYLKGEILHAEICGVNSKWIRKVIKTYGITL